MKVGIIGSIRADILGVPLSYAEYIRNFIGGEIVILSNTSSIQEDLDLLLLPGGADINPERYGANPSYMTGSPDIYKDYFDLHHLPLYMSKKCSIFAVCRGFQSVSVALGGTLIQDMYHETNKKDDPYELVHDVYDSSGKKMFKVNSRHHQAIDRLGEGLIPTLFHKDGTIEAFEHEELPIFGVQFHPEDMYDKDSNDYIINKLKKIMRK